MDSSDTTSDGGDEREGAALDSRVAEGERLIEKHVVAAVAVGFVPVPFVDLAALMAVQLNMLRGLGELYGESMSEQILRSLLASLAGGLVPLSSVSLLKSIPMIGSVLGGASAPVLTGAATYAVGRVFVQHFESGGTFLSLDPDRVRAHYKAEFERGEQLVREDAFRDAKP